MIAILFVLLCIPVIGIALFCSALIVARELDVLNGYDDQMGCQEAHGEYVDEA